MPKSCSQFNTKGFTVFIFLFIMIINYNQKRYKPCKNVGNVQQHYQIYERGSYTAGWAGEIISVFNNFRKTDKLKKHKKRTQYKCGDQKKHSQSILLLFNTQ